MRIRFVVAGEAAVALADGDGSFFVSASTADAEYAISPIRTACLTD